MEDKDLELDGEVITEEEIKDNLLKAQEYNKITNEIAALGSFEDFRKKNPNLSEEEAAETYFKILDGFMEKMGFDLTEEEGGLS